MSATASIKFSQIPKAIFLTLKHPGINVLAKATTVIPLIAAPALMVGLTASQSLNKRLNDGQPNDPTLEALAKVYPVAYGAMMLCGALNGLCYASFCRTLSYTLLFLGSIYNGVNEYNMIEAKKKLAELEALLKLPSLDQATKDQIDEHADQVYAQIAKNTGNLAFFSRCLFPLFMAATFWSNITQQKRKYFCPPPQGGKLKDFFADFKAKFIPNMRREIQAGLDCTKNGLFSIKNWKSIIEKFNEKDLAYKAELDRKGVKGFDRFLTKFSNPDFNINFILINMYLRLATAIGTMGAVVALGGNETFNIGNQYQNEDIAAIAHEKKGMQWLFSFFSFLNNIGLVAMGFSSIFIGLNPFYRKETGLIPARLQIMGGSFVILSAILDWMKLYLPGAAAKFTSNTFLQMGNIFGTFNSVLGGGLTAQRMATAGAR